MLVSASYGPGQGIHNFANLSYSSFVPLPYGHRLHFLTRPGLINAFGSNLSRRPGSRSSNFRAKERGEPRDSPERHSHSAIRQFRAHTARQLLLQLHDACEGVLGWIGLISPLGGLQLSPEPDLGLVQADGMLPACLHLGILCVGLYELVALVGERPLDGGDHALKTRFLQFGAYFRPFKGLVLRKLVEKGLAQTIQGR